MDSKSRDNEKERELIHHLAVLRERLPLIFRHLAGTITTLARMSENTPVKK